MSISAYWAAHGPLFGRDAERSAICRLLDDASVRPAGLVLEGEVGIGKTVLLDEGTELARDRSFLVLRSRPAAAETGFAYGALSDLLAPIGGEVLGALDPALQDALGAASAILEEICACGCNAGACHAQMYTMGMLLRHGSEAQKTEYLPRIAAGELRLQAFGVTEPDAGSDTTKISTFARRSEAGYVVDGQKIWTSRAEHSDLMILLARTTPASDVEKKTEGLSVFLVDLRNRGSQLTIKPIATMMNHATTEVFMDGLELPAEALIGEEGQGFRYILDGMNAERILIAAECIGDGRFFVERGSAYASGRVVFGKPIGANQGVQFPLAHAHMAIEAANLMRWKAAWLYDGGEPAGAEANMAKFLASEASWQAANAALDAHGGFGFAAEYDIERKFRETRLYKTAPVNNNLVQAFVAQHVLGLPRSY